MEDDDGLIHDPIENDPQIRPVIEKAWREAELELAHVPRTLGFCHLFCATQKHILREKYGIDWRSAIEMNPDVIFD